MSENHVEELREEIRKFSFELSQWVIPKTPKPEVLVNSLFVVATLGALSSGHTKEQIFQLITSICDEEPAIKEMYEHSLEKEKA